MKACRICRNESQNRTIAAREMMFGTRDEFEYLECSKCGTVQLVDVPDLMPYYPPDYLSLGDVGEIAYSTTLVRRISARVAGSYLRSGRGILGRFLVYIKPWIADGFPPSMRRRGLRADSKILEVGCGTGKLLETLVYLGFRRLKGADPFIESDIEYPSGVSIAKSGLAGIEGEFDLVMLHHVFEHLPDPRAALREIRRLIGKKGTALIRMPVVSDAWARYGRDWVQLDPPRHIFLFTEKGFCELAAEEGFEVTDVVYDSTEMQFWGSEQYLSDVPLNDPRTHNYPNEGTLFSDAQMREWKLEADELNRRKRGDQAAYYLRRI